MNFKKLLLPFVILLILVTSCVPSKKYNELLSQKADADKRLRNYKADTEKAQEEMETQLEKLESDFAKMNAEKSELETSYNSLKNENESLKGRYDELLKNNQIQLGSASAEKAALTQQLSEKEKELDAKARELKALEGSLNRTRTEIDKAKAKLEAAQAANAEKEKNVKTLQSELAEREKRVNELETLIKEQENRVKALKDRVNAALLGFNEADLTVEQRNGKVYVSLSQNLLFASGSTNVDSKGKDALKKLATVLNANSDIDIQVEGHTDNVPIRRGAIKDNWDLSVLRSTSIVRELVDGGVDPKRVSASGRGEHFPKSDNSTRSGRADNRRSEIILSPKLDELYNLIGN